MTAGPATAPDKRAELRDRLLRKRRQDRQDNDQIVAGPPVAVAELSSQQSGMWLSAQLAGASTSYHIANLMRLRGPLDVATLRGALAAMIDRHESLRTSFAEQDGVPRLLIAPPPGRSWWEELDLSGVPEPVREQRALWLIGDSWGHAIDLRHAPLLRVFLVRLAEAEHLFGYVLHHIVGDGWSMPILAAELSELYRAAVAGREPRLPAHRVQPSDVYRWQRDRLATEAVQRRLDARRDQLAGLPRLAGLPTDRPRPATGTSAGRIAVLALPAELVARADALARGTARTPFAVLVAAFAVLLRQRTGQHDLAIGTVFSGRVRSEMEPLIGYFANTGVLRIQIAPDQSVDDLIGRCHESVLEAQRVQDIPFSDVVGAVAPVRVPGANPLFQVCFTLARGKVGVAPLDLEGVTAELIEVLPPGSNFDLTFQVTERADGSYALYAQYASELFDESSVLQLAADYRDVLAEMLPATGACGLAVGQLLAGTRPPRAAAPPSRPEPLPDVPATGPAEPVPGTGTLRDHLARIWAEVFGVPGDFDDDQSFFEVGGTSIMAVRLRARILSEFAVDLDLADIFAGGSVAELVGCIEAGLAATGPAAADPGG